MTEKKVKKKATKSAKPAAKKDTGEAAVLEKIAAMPEPYRHMGERRHALILRSAPALQPTVWYGMPAYAKRPDRLLLPRGQEIHDIRLQPAGEPDSRGGRAGTG